jgi:hypothetical protein
MEAKSKLQVRIVLSAFFGNFALIFDQILHNDQVFC